jgi:hypothetical protein
MEPPLRPVAALILALLAGAPPARADSPPADLKALDRDDAAAEAALASGDLAAALNYFDYFGHEQEDFCRATLEYRLARQELGNAVRQALGRRAWGRAARVLAVPRHNRGRGPADRTVRREGSVVYLRNAGAANEVPYVNVNGVWKVSTREVLATALRARFGKDVEYEEADLYVLAGKMAHVLRGRARQLSELTADVREKRITTAEQLNAAVEKIRRGSPAP